jgi:hypothetical protein
LSLLYPKIPPDRWLAVFGVAGVGALVAGWYGIIHDQITYTISPEYFTRVMFRLSLSGFAIIISCAVVFAVAGFAYGLAREVSVETSGIAAFGIERGVKNVSAFVRVAYIHNASYLGGLFGPIAAALFLRRKARQRRR